MQDIYYMTSERAGQPQKGRDPQVENQWYRRRQHLYLVSGDEIQGALSLQVDTCGWKRKSLLIS